MTDADQAGQARSAVVVLGKNNVGDRVAEALAEKRIPYSFVEVTDDVVILSNVTLLTHARTHFCRNEPDPDLVCETLP